MSNHITRGKLEAIIALAEGLLREIDVEGKAIMPTDLKDIYTQSMDKEQESRDLEDLEKLAAIQAQVKQVEAVMPQIQSRIRKTLIKQGFLKSDAMSIAGTFGVYELSYYGKYKKELVEVDSGRFIVSVWLWESHFAPIVGMIDFDEDWRIIKELPPMFKAYNYNGGSCGGSKFDTILKKAREWYLEREVEELTRRNDKLLILLPQHIKKVYDYDSPKSCDLLLQSRNLFESETRRMAAFEELKVLSGRKGVNDDS